MLWSRTASPIPTALPDIAPTHEDLRRAVLQASWARDRRVGRRRLAMRWAQWALWRYVLPALLVMAAAALVWSWLLPEMPSRLVRKALAQQQKPVGVGLEPVAKPTATDPVVPESLAAIPPASGAIPEPDILQLQFESRWGNPPMSGPKDDPVEALSLPTLKPENWLHSKEP